VSSKPRTEECYADRFIRRLDAHTVETVPCGAIVTFVNHVGTCPRCGITQRVTVAPTSAKVVKITAAR
jgi:hypothetical protein